MKGLRWEQMLRGQGCTSHVTVDVTGDLIGQKGHDGDVTRIAPSWRCDATGSSPPRATSNRFRASPHTKPIRPDRRYLSDPTRDICYRAMAGDV